MTLFPPEGFAVRAAKCDDLESVLQLITGQNMADYGEAMISADRLRERWASWDLDLASGTWVVIASNGSLAGYAELCRREHARYALAVYIASAHRGKGLGAHLLQLAETRAMTASADATRLELTARVSARNKTGMRDFELAGFTLKLSFLVMGIVMDAPPPVARWVKGITVRTFFPGQDEVATYLVDERTSEDKGYHKPLTFDGWAQRMSLKHYDFDPNLWFLACRQGEIVGVALNAYSQQTDTGWIDHLGVLREWRKRGIGLGLLMHSLGEFYRRGIKQVKLSVDSKSLTNAPRLYERAGMHAIQEYHIYNRLMSRAVRSEEKDA